MPMLGRCDKYPDVHLAFLQNLLTADVDNLVRIEVLSRCTSM